jgi:hypothetical protein
MHAPDPAAAVARYHCIQQLRAQLTQLVSSSAEQRDMLDRVLEEALRVADAIERELKRRAPGIDQKVGESCTTRPPWPGCTSPMPSREQVFNTAREAASRHRPESV